MLTIIPFVTIVSIASAIVTPSQLYRVVDRLVDLYMNGSCLVIISNGGYTAGSNVPVVYVDPFNEDIEDHNTTSGYKMAIIAPVLELGCKGIILQVKNPGKQLGLVEKTFVHVNQRTHRRFIILPTITRLSNGSIDDEAEVLDSEFDFRSVLREDFIRHIPDVVFAVPNDEDNLVDIWTHRFSGPDNISRQEMILDTYNVAEKRFALSADLFPDKVKDLEGKVLRIAMFHYPPYSVIVDDDDDDDRQIDGTEWRFVVEFAKLHNCSLEELIDNDGAWGQIYENLTGNGITGNVLEDRADIGITSLYTWYHESLYLDLSAPLSRSGITCLVPGPLQIPQWMSPIRPFAPTVWITFIGMTIVSAIFTGIVNRAEAYIRSEDSVRISPCEAALTVAGITLLQGLTKDPKGPSWAALSVTLLIVGLLVTTAYGSSLASAMTVPRYEMPIDTAFELASSGIFWAGTSPAWLFSIRNADEPEMRTLVKNFRVLTPLELFRKSVEDENWAFSIERLQAGHYSIQDYLRSEPVEKMHLMKTDIYWEYCVAMLRKSSPYTKWYSQRTHEIQASGIPTYWEAEIARRYLDGRTQLAVKADHFVGGDPVKITVQHVQGTFFILVIGLFISGLVFLVEISLDKCK